jgi:hypothetical protein
MTNDLSRRTLQLLRGCIGNLRTVPCRREVVFTASDRSKMGTTTIAAGLAGLGGIAAGLGGMAVDTTEEADLLEFELDGMPVTAWVWVSVFNEGDEVEVAAERIGEIWYGYGIRRISDGIVALHPHCSRGRYAHFWASFSWFVKIVGALLIVSWMGLAITAYFKSLPAHDIFDFVLFVLMGSAMGALIYGVIAFNIARRFMGFVRLAEGIFEIFGWPNVKRIDLPALTKKTKAPGDPGALGVLYFRY